MKVLLLPSLRRHLREKWQAIAITWKNVLHEEEVGVTQSGNPVFLHQG